MGRLAKGALTKRLAIVRLEGWGKSTGTGKVAMPLNGRFVCLPIQRDTEFGLLDEQRRTSCQGNSGQLMRAPCPESQPALAPHPLPS